MKKLISIAALALALTSPVFAQKQPGTTDGTHYAYDWYVTTVNSGNNALAQWYEHVDTLTDMFSMSDGTNNGQPVTAYLGTGLYWDHVNHVINVVPSIMSVFANAPSRAIQTVAGAANGFTLSASQNSAVTYSVSTTTTATIGGASTGYIVLEVCGTNSATAASWQEISRSGNSQNITLALALNSVQVVTSPVNGMVPAGYYVRLRSVISSGTPTFAFISGQEVQL